MLMVHLHQNFTQLPIPGKQNSLAMPGCFAGESETVMAVLPDTVFGDCDLADIGPNGRF